MLNVPNVFTQGAMKALVQAQISAASMGHEKMGSGHLLCGLCRVGDELTRCILGDLTAGEIEEEVLRRCGRSRACAETELHRADEKGARTAAWLSAP